MKSQGIEVYLRIRPTKKIFKGLEVDADNHKVSFKLEKDLERDVVNNSSSLYVYDHF